MELRDFVTQALIEIAEGVVQAQLHIPPTGAQVNPDLTVVPSKGESFGMVRTNPVLMVNFDVAVTASEGTKSKGGIGVVTGIVSLGSTGTSDKSETAVSRLSFRIPLLLPIHENPEAK